MLEFAPGLCRFTVVRGMVNVAMLLRLAPLRSSTQRRMCLSCGTRAHVLDHHESLAVFRCPSCGADLYARPPRSYAEMEGLTAHVPFARALARIFGPIAALLRTLVRGGHFLFGHRSRPLLTPSRPARYRARGSRPGQSRGVLGS
ncbi:MAG: hypothetical protein ACT4PL_09775 [Phycisphaerales bacterium]